MKLIWMEWYSLLKAASYGDDVKKDAGIEMVKLLIEYVKEHNINLKMNI